MSINTKRDSSVDHRLARVLDSPFLARVVPHLPPETLHQLIRHRGLEACGELVTLATPAQLNSLLDLDLWRHPRPGRDERFDVERFGEWLEVLVDTGESIAARTIAVLDRNVVIAGLTRYVRVFDPGIFEPTAQSDDERSDYREAMRQGDAIHAGSGSSSLECEVGGYIVRARRADAWDSIVALMVALEDEHADYFHAVMQGCRDLSNSRPEESAMDDLLLEPEQQLHDLAIEREHRRSQQGYATPGDARAFLEMARKPRSDGSINPIVAAYFRAADQEIEAPTESTPLLSAATSSASDVAPIEDARESVEAVLALLTEAGVMPDRPRALLEAGDVDEEVSKLALLRRLMAHVRDTNEAIYLARTRELAFLANTLLAGCSVQSRPFTPAEASDAAAATCNLGLEHLPPQPVSSSYLIDHDLIAAFEAGWSVLHKDVSCFAAQQLISTLADLNGIDRDIRLELVALRRKLVKELEAGTPSRARDAVEVLALLDPTAWVSVLGLLDECPILPATITAVLEGRTTTISPMEFEFISTATQVADARRFAGTIALHLTS